jgi:hypothetical protein
VGVRVVRAGVVSLSFLLLAAMPGYSQAPPPFSPQPVTGFVSAYEIMKTARSAGFDPLAPPLREGTTYVLRATDYRGILMRVVVDARTGAIRDVNRIVPNPGRYGEIGGGPPPYGLPPYKPADFDLSMTGPSANLPSTARGATFPSALVPLPRPRPATLASRGSSGDANAALHVLPQLNPKSGMNAGSNVSADGAARPDASSGVQINSEVTTTVPPAAPVAPKKDPAVVPPLND